MCVEAGVLLLRVTRLYVVCCCWCCSAAAYVVRVVVLGVRCDVVGFLVRLAIAADGVAVVVGVAVVSLGDVLDVAARTTKLAHDPRSAHEPRFRASKANSTTESPAHQVKVQLLLLAFPGPGRQGFQWRRRI